MGPQYQTLEQEVGTTVRWDSRGRHDLRIAMKERLGIDNEAGTSKRVNDGRSQTDRVRAGTVDC